MDYFKQARLQPLTYFTGSSGAINGVLPSVTNTLPAWCGPVAGNRGVAAHALLWPFSSMVIPSAVEQVRSAVLRTFIGVTGKDC